MSRDPLVGYTDIITLPADTVDNRWDAGLTVPTAIEGFEPTAVELVRFAATPAHDRITLLWETSAEQDTNGFHLYRSTNIQRSKAVRMTPQMVPAQGPGGGVYMLDDVAVVRGVTYHYWLVEVENGVEAAEFGPVRGRVATARTAAYPLYLPVIVGQRE